LFAVVKHEALAVRRQRERAAAAGSAEDVEAFSPERADNPAERASGSERNRRAAEALTYLKAAEVRCMLLKALGFSYEEIAQRTGFSFTKVNRSLTEGRRTFLQRFDRLSAGAGCDELQPLLSAASDRECSPPDRSRLEAHLAACGSCRATLRMYRDAPARLAELLPPAVLLPVLERAGWWTRLAGWFDAGPAERASSLAQKLHGNAEMLSAKKAAAVMASTAALAGGTAVEQHVTHPHSRPSTQAHKPKHERRTTAASPATAPPATRTSTAASSSASTAARAAAARQRRARSKQGEFSFESAGSATASTATTASPTASAAASGGGSGEFGGPGAGGSASASGGEFGP
jgi:hypothetical protein